MNLFHMNRSELYPIEKAVRDNIEEYFPGAASSFFIVGVSGGVDSMALLHTFRRLDISALVAHVNYQKRGEASDKDAELVKRMAKEWGFECHTISVDPAGAEGENFQQWARDVRYELFRDLAEEQGAQAIALAHHEDDQVETILQKLFRGAGLASWAGMQVRDGDLFRPLLNVSRAQIEEYASRNSIPFRTDLSNLQTDFARNFLRQEWLDKLSGFFPGWKSNVLRAAEQAGHFEEAVRWIAGRVRDERGIKRELFHSLEPALQRSLILFLIKQREPGIQLSRGSLERVRELANLQTGQEVALTPEFSVHRDRDYYVILRKGAEEFSPVQLEKDQLTGEPLSLGDIELVVEEFNKPDFGSALYLDVDKLSWPVTIRRWRPGDEIRPLGMQGHQQVSEHLTNRKISSAYKSRALVVESFEDTICAIIFPPIKNKLSPGTISEGVKCDTETKYSLKIKHRK